ncbi:unnamed protein product [Linum trigynum]|uniref:Chlororespiratory reduction 3 n=1 Tax=Linum trigynum TaxID=586398 RepID=A0AAV2CZR6_9ROSI
MANYLVFASSLPNTNPAAGSSSSPSPQTRTTGLPATPQNPIKPKAPLILPATTSSKTNLKKSNNANSKLLRQQFKVLRVERAIGAGSYRDAEPPGAAEGRGSGIAELWLESEDGSNRSNNPFEGPVEKKIRETGEWLAYKTENDFRISEKQSLTLLYKWALPISLLAMMVAVGVVKLPFLSPLLDDFIM